MSATQSHLDVARRIGERLVRTAIPEARGLTWTVMAPDRDNPDARVAVATPAGAGLYAGTAGIALFLAELYGATRDAALLPALEGALEHALAGGAEFADTAFGFHSGRVGVAYAAVRAGEVLDEPRLFARAAALLAPLSGRERGDHGLDVIGGAAGAIPALLRMAERLDADLATGLARGLGDHLLQVAERETGGWSWGTMKLSSARNLCGYAHGGAGFFHALLELAHAVGEGAYRFGAEQAWLYERQFLDAELGNWPDLRHTEVGEYLYAGRVDDLRDRLRRGEEVPGYTPRYMSAWCHGAPGIGLTRLRAWELLGDPVLREEAEAAIRATLGTLNEPQANYSLCHGQAGNAETLLLGAGVLGDPALREAAERCALRGRARYEDAGLPWPCGTLGGVSDPSLLLGEAGIGLFFLRLHDPAVPSALLVTPRAATVAPAADPAPGWRAQRDAAAEDHFGRALRIFAALGVETSALLPAPDPARLPRTAVAAALHDALAARVAAEPDPARAALLADALRPDAARFELAATATDFTAEYLAGLARPAEDEVPWDEAALALGPRVRVVEGAYDWDAWLAAGDPAAPPPPADVFFLLQRVGARVGVRPLSPFAALVLGATAERATVAEVVDRVDEATGGGVDRALLQGRVLDQLRGAYRAGLVEHARVLATA